MTTVRAIVFDLDDTLCDYTGAKAAARAEIDQVLSDRRIPSAAFWRAYAEREPALFRAWLANEISLESYRTRRFLGPLEMVFGPSPASAQLALRLSALYMEHCNRRVRLFPDVVDALTTARRGGFQLALLTNGPADGQRDKLACLGIEPHFDAIQISEEAGVAKPDPAAFLRLTATLGASPAECLMVGDSEADDIAPARAAGLQAVLLDRAGRSERSLRSLRDLVGRLAG